MPFSGMWRRIVFVCTVVAASTCSRWFLALRFVYPEDEGDTILRNVGSHKNYIVPHPKKRHLYGHRRENLKSYKKHSFADTAHFSEIFQRTIFHAPISNGAIVAIGSKISKAVIFPLLQYRLDHKTGTCTAKLPFIFFKHHVMKTFGE
jgi:hypothetical protein